MANVVIQDIEVAAEKVLGWLGGAGKIIAKVEGMEPQVAAALGTLLGAVGSAISGASADASNPSVTLSAAEIANIKAVWNDITAFMSTFGVKL